MSRKALKKRHGFRPGGIGGALCLFILACGSGCAALGQAPETTRQKEQPAIRVAGEAVVSLPPDMAQIVVGVVSEAESAQTAAADNARRVDAVVSELRRLLGGRGDLKTSGYSVTPVYRHPREGAKPVIAGYSAHNAVQITVGELAEVGKIIDTSIRAGANIIQRLEFKLKDETAAQAEALRRAAANGRAKAQAIASELGLKIIRIIAVEETGVAPPRPLDTAVYAMRQEAAAPPTPVEPGTIDVRASVVLEVEVGQ